MLSSKSKSGLSEGSQNKTSPATPKISRISRGVTKSDSNSPSPLQNSRLSIVRSPRSVESKPSVDRRSPKLTTPPDKQPIRALKGSELQAQLNIVQEDLKKSKERLATVEKEKARALEELKEAKRLSEEANGKLGEALVAQKRAEDDSEIEKFRAVELEQATIEAAQKREEEWQKELEAIKNQHAVDLDALLSTTQELQRVKHELAMTSDAKNQALNHADDATKIAEIHAEKVELLSTELGQLKSLLDSKMDTEDKEKAELVRKLNSEVDILKQELDSARIVEEKLAEKEALINQLRIEVDSAKKAELDKGDLVDEWRKKVEELEVRFQEANQSEKSALDSVASLMKQLEESSVLLHDRESEIASLRVKVESLEIALERQREDLKELEWRFNSAKQEALEMKNMVESLNSELETVKEEKMQALNNEELAATSVQNLLEEKHKLMDELEASRDEEEKSKNAMESLAAALHEVSSEAREAKERLLANQAELENSKFQIEDLNLALKSSKDNYEAMLDEARQKIVLLTNSTEQSKLEFQDSKAEWEAKEFNLLNCIKNFEEETSSLKREMEKVVSLLKESKEEADAASEEGARLHHTLKEAESEVSSYKEVVKEAKDESLRLKEMLLDKENELQYINQENEDLRTREVVAVKKAEDLSILLQEELSKKEELSMLLKEALAKKEETSKLLEESLTKKQTEENGELSDSERDYDLLPKVVEFSEQNGNRREDKPRLELPCKQVGEPMEDKDLSKDNAVPIDLKLTNGNENQRGVENKEKEDEEDDDSVKVEVKMWESCKIGEKDFLPEGEQEAESNEEELNSKADSESLDQANGLSTSENAENGGNSPSKQQEQKKKKPLLRKFGNLLKKKGSSNQK